MHIALVKWVAHCTRVIGSIREGDQKGLKYTCFARSAFCTGNLYYLYALGVNSVNSVSSLQRGATFISDGIFVVVVDDVQVIILRKCFVDFID